LAPTAAVTASATALPEGIREPAPPTAGTNVAASIPAFRPAVILPRRLVAPPAVVAPRATSPTKDARSSIVRDAPF
jgi:hypothetical protein